MTSRSRDNLRGWLRRKGHRLHTWSRRWFVLSDKFLFVYAREDDKKHQDVITLSKQLIVDPPIDPNDPKIGLFDIVNEKNPSESIYLCAETPEEKKMWMQALRRALYADKGGALFSQSLEEILFWEKTEGRQIPYIVDECVEYLYKYGLDAEGIFRLGGRMASIKEIIARFERGEKIKFEDENTDIHVVSSILKTFLRDLPDSIIPCAYFQRFMNIAMRYMDGKSADIKIKEQCIQDLAASMKEIPKDNYIILKYICRFLSKVAQHETKNKMNSLTVGTIFGPNVIRHIDAENPHLHLCTADLGQHLVHMMLQYFTQVFALEYSENDPADNSIPTADLLCMANVDAIPVPLPRRLNTVRPISHVLDLEGIDLSSRTRLSSNGSSSTGMVEDFFSAPNSPYPEDLNDYVFPDSGEQTSNKLAFKRRTLHLSLKGTKLGNDSSQDPTSPLSDPSGMPIAPARRRSKKLIRNRRVLDQQRPNVVGYKWDNMSPPNDSPETVDSSNELNAHSSVMKSQTLPPGMSLSSPDFTAIAECNAAAPDKGEPAPKLSPAVPEEDSLQFKLGPSPDDLKLQVTILKVEIGDQRERYRTQVSELKSQLSEMQSKYELRIEKMETEFKSQKQLLEDKLNKERLSCSTAVERTVRLKEQLHEYQMHYGELAPK